MKLVIHFLLIAATMMGLSRWLPGFTVTTFTSAVVAAIVLAAMNTIVRPILFLLTLPFTLITLGLFLFVLNAMMLWLTDLLVPGLAIQGKFTLLIASIILAVVGMIWKWIAADGKKER